MDGGKVGCKAFQDYRLASLRVINYGYRSLFQSMCGRYLTYGIGHRFVRVLPKSILCVCSSLYLYKYILYWNLCSAEIDDIDNFTKGSPRVVSVRELWCEFLFDFFPISLFYHTKHHDTKKFHSWSIRIDEFSNGSWRQHLLLLPAQRFGERTTYFTCCTWDVFRRSVW